MTTDSELVFAELANEENIQVTSSDQLTVADLTAFLDRFPEVASEVATASKEIRAHALRGINEVRVQGSHYAAAKTALSGYFMVWCQTQRDLYVESGGKEGFWHSDSTILNYRNVYEAAANRPNEYETFRVQNWPLEIFYRIAAKLVDGETVESIDGWLDLKYRTKMIAAKQGAAVLEESIGNGCPVPDTYPALIAMCDSGEISKTRANEIVTACESGYMEPIVAETARLFGVRDVVALKTLVDVADSIRNADRNGEPYNNTFATARKTGGYIEDDNGDMIALRDMSAREIWKAHIRGRYEGIDGDDSGDDDPTPKPENLLKTDIDVAEAIAIARLLNEYDLVTTIEKASINQRYTVKLDKPA